ncbi:MAG: XdhC family protein [Gammaproteobacteria bacterium]|nr:XdhC family protein [Gammaproteobacteria bacterium]
MSFQTRGLLSKWRAHADSSQWVLGVVYKTEGPCYRKPGAMMLFNSEGEHYGLLSGGCLEADIQRHARKVMETNRAITLCYDGNDEDDISFQLGIGCGGTVFIALLPITTHNKFLQLAGALEALENRQSCQLCLKIPDTSGDTDSRLSVNLEDTELTEPVVLVSEKGIKWLRVNLTREPHLLVIGGGIDAKPVVSLSRELGWEVTLWDSRPANARRDEFLSASTILNCRVDELTRYALDQRVDAAILMTHNIELDASALVALSEVPLRYLGLLGPTSRRRRVLAEAKLSEDHIHTELSGPAGYDLGGDLPESIALSMLSECHAYLHGCGSDTLKRKR